MNPPIDHPGDEAWCTLQTPVGTVTVVSDGETIVRVAWRSSPSLTAGGVSDAVLIEARNQIAAYFDGALREFDLPLDLGEQSEASRAVLMTLAETVAHGETVTYGELARRSGTSVPARGIGAIMGANPVPIIVPCHRVVAGDGLGGYSGGERGRGLETKRWLLEFEGALPPALF